MVMELRPALALLLSAGLSNGAVARKQVEPTSGIFIEGISLEQARANGWFRFKDYESASRRFPNVGACMPSGSRRTTSLAIDWYRIGSDIEADVCLSRVASKIGSAKGMVAWMTANGFRVTSFGKTEWYYTSRSHLLDSMRIEAAWSIKKNGPMTRRGIMAPLMQWLLGHGVSIVIFFDERRKQVSVQCSTTIL